MAEPMKGWRVLTDLLKPKGFMKIALYSDLARQPVVAARAFIQERGYQSTPEDIRACRHALLKLADEDGVKKVAIGKDFYTTEVGWK
jgi:hypothetical protein